MAFRYFAAALVFLAAPLLSGCIPPPQITATSLPLDNAEGAGSSVAIGFRSPPTWTATVGLSWSYEFITLPELEGGTDSVTGEAMHATLMYPISESDRFVLYAMGGGRIDTVDLLYGYEVGGGIEMTILGDRQLTMEQPYGGLFVEGGYGSLTHDSYDAWQSHPVVRVGLALRPF